MQIPAPFDSAGTFLGYPVRSPQAEVEKVPQKDRKSAARWSLVADFRVFSRYVCVNRVDKSYRKAIINYLRESNTKIGQNRQWSSTSGSNNMLS